MGSRTGEITASAARGMPAQAEQHISASSLNEKLHPQTRRTSSFRGWHRMARQPRFSARAIQEWSKPISRPCGAPLPSNMPLKASRCLPSEVRSSLARPPCRARRSLCPCARPAVAQSRFRTDRARGAAAFCENPWQRRNSIGIEAAAHWQPRSLPSLRRSCGSDRLPAGLRRTVRSPWQSRSRSGPTRSPWRRSGGDPRRSLVL